ncbi:MAG: phosphoenolpyruvate--protein phosphotransferase, partial [Anaerolineales bacterium]|nr:phosphoenolpyruvate--protein phosphotransferase [Anaerolineales bacterium]
MRELAGISASRGIAIGPAFQFRQLSMVCVRCVIQDPAAEWARFEAAVAAARQQLSAVSARALAEAGTSLAVIFQAQALMLEDPELLERVREAIEGERINA